MTRRTPRQDCNYIIYAMTSERGDSYIGLTRKSLPNADKVADYRATEEKIMLFSVTLPKMLTFLKIDYFPLISQFKFDSSVYQFESPLNFLMMRADFKEFVESFFQAEALLKYALQFYTDSLFTINIAEDRQDHTAKK